MCRFSRQGALDFSGRQIHASTVEEFMGAGGCELHREAPVIVVGIIGRNGAGKIHPAENPKRITEPTKGRVTIRWPCRQPARGRHRLSSRTHGPREYLSQWRHSGHDPPRDQSQVRRDRGFCGSEKFLDTPVKRYSSGMYVRLAFAVAAHLEPEILVVDEVLSVGDAEFQRKCLGKMKDVAGQGRTVLFVSHQMDAVLRLCNTARCSSNTSRHVPVPAASSPSRNQLPRFWHKRSR
jgi:lipopolysaccharide transport system ATP-binding protein